MERRDFMTGERLDPPTVHYGFNLERNSDGSITFRWDEWSDDPLDYLTLDTAQVCSLINDLCRLLVETDAPA